MRPGADCRERGTPQLDQFQIVRNRRSGVVGTHLRCCMLLLAVEDANLVSENVHLRVQSQQLATSPHTSPTSSGPRLSAISQTDPNGDATRPVAGLTPAEPRGDSLICCCAPLAAATPLPEEGREFAAGPGAGDNPLFHCTEWHLRGSERDWAKLAWRRPGDTGGGLPSGTNLGGLFMDEVRKASLPEASR